MTITTTALALPERLQRYLDRQVARRARRGLPAPQIQVRLGEEVFRLGSDQPFHAASVGKLTVTAMALQEIAAGRLDWDTRVADVLGGEAVAGIFASDAVTIRHLLTHTSGAADFFEDKATGTLQFRQLLLAEPQRDWSAGDLLDFARTHQRPLAQPGERYRYSDTGFTTLALCIEASAGQRMPALLPDRILTPAGMTDSFHWQPNGASANIQPMLLERTDLSESNALSCAKADASLVTTTADLDRLLRALQDGTLVPNQLWQQAQQFEHRFRAGIWHGAGVQQLRFGGFSPFLAGLTRPIGHLGVTSVHAFHYPELDASITMNFHATGEMMASFQTHIRLAVELHRLARGRVR